MSAQKIPDSFLIISLFAIVAIAKENVLNNITTNQVVKANYKEAVAGINRNPAYQTSFTEATAQVLSTIFAP